jgi:predicted DCC family thiol-disulfide oxidoreductase YuxK
MAPQPRSASTPEGRHPVGRHLVLYDGVCGLCDHLVQFLLARDRRRVFHFAALQSAAGKSALERSGGNPAALTTFYVLADYRTGESRLFKKSRAALFVARSLGWPWRAAGLFGLLPTSILDFGYDLVARNRYRLFGRHEQCLLPRAEDRDRFIDVLHEP